MSAQLCQQNECLLPLPSFVVAALSAIVRNTQSLFTQVRYPTKRQLHYQQKALQAHWMLLHTGTDLRFEAGVHCLLTRNSCYEPIHSLYKNRALGHTLVGDSLPLSTSHSKRRTAAGVCESVCVGSAKAIRLINTGGASALVANQNQTNTSPQHKQTFNTIA